MGRSGPISGGQAGSDRIMPATKQNKTFPSLSQSLPKGFDLSPYISLCFICN
jgi:hypothetical protein